MSQGSLARRYARALIEIASAEKPETLAEVESQLNDLSGLFQDHQNLFGVLCNHTLPQGERKNVLKEVFNSLKLNRDVQHFLLLLIDKKRLEIFPEIQREYSILADAKRGIVRAKVRFAKGVDSEIKTNIQKQLERISGKKIVCEFEEDERLIGGVVTTIGFTEVDGSIATQINEMKKQLISQKSV